jgi:hypothetical protein
MPKLQNKPLKEPDETRPIEKGTIEIVHLDAGTVLRTTFEPGWRWSECVKPIAGTESCQTHHFGYCISGYMLVVMDDGTEMEVGPGEAIEIPSGHDAWVTSDEPYVAIDRYRRGDVRTARVVACRWSCADPGVPRAAGG